MSNNYAFKSSKICSICQRNAGVISIEDGIVCNECMPQELLEKASSLNVSALKMYHKLHGIWEPCKIETETDRALIKAEDRSMAITIASDTTLSDQLNAQIVESTAIDMVVSFIKTAGLNLILDSLREFSHKGRLRVITTSYMGVTEYEALHELFNLPNTTVKMELNAGESHLHAKSFIFKNEQGEYTAFVGSANLSKTALTSGEEWVVKLKEQDVPQIISDLNYGFDMLWSSPFLKTVTKIDRATIEKSLDNGGL